MPARWLVFVLFAVLAWPVVAPAKEAPSEYAALLARLKAGDTKIDYARLRLSWVDSPEHKHAKDTSNAAEAMFEALNAKNFPTALIQAETVLAGEYVNIDAHYVAAVANRQMGATDKADFHRAVFGGLIDSIRNSGDGKSLATAWVVINVHEEYVLLRVLGLSPSGQAVIHKDGHSYDEMKAKAEDGAEQTFYFNVDIPFREYKF